MISDELPAYPYQSLAAAATETTETPPRLSFMIRALKLKPSTEPTAPLRCEIVHIDITDPDGYESISSSASGDKETMVKITPSLDEALRAFRLPDKARTLWADAVCINQKDNEERTLQVSRMGFIYAYASSVLVWLGTGEDVLSCINFLWGLSSSGHEHCATTKHANKVVKYELKRAFKHTEIHPIVRFFDLPWFKRRWIIQEAVLASKCVYRYGSYEIARHAFGHALYILALSDLPFDRRVLSRITNIDTLASEHENGSSLSTYGQRSILDLLVRFNDASGADHRDRIFALSALADDFGNPPWTNESAPDQELLVLKADYEASVNDLYFDFATKMLLHKDHLEILQCAGAFRPFFDIGPLLGELNWPSWVPDWRDPMNFTPFLNVPWFRAGGDRVDSAPIMRDRVCQLTGVVAGTIDVVHHLVDRLTGSNKPRSPLIQFCDSIGMFGRYHTGEYVWQALGVTLTADHALNSTIRKRYAQHSPNRYPWGKLMKKNARTRDSQVLLDWWTQFREQEDASWAPSFPGNVSTEKQTLTKEKVQQIVQDHQPSLQQDGPKSAFFKPPDARKLWAPASTHAPSKTHIRVDDEDLPYFFMMMDDYKRGPRRDLPKKRGELPVVERMSTADDMLAGMEMLDITVTKKRGGRFWNKGAIEPILEDLDIASLTAGDRTLPGHENEDLQSDPEDDDKASLDGTQRPEATEEDPSLSSKNLAKANDQLYRDADGEWRVQNGGLIWLDPHVRNTERYERTVQQTLRGRSLLITTDGLLGVGPRGMEEGDTIAVLHGARTPLILRPAETAGNWIIVGDCYVHGLMKGEALNVVGLEERTFDIVATLDTVVDMGAAVIALSAF
ncbi:hypothetical protein FALBO_16633 [Fusarium albosuccineum]|uniref:Heterokaryon incompatibility domain-containing protein n=1 Tax=Fusarium albosuccineum TaxID=1237068 RepID=A0A8H4KHY0_9HYPO|nr:hypothetical protein FALBO_16633 [Fusarium albosuccineum]